MILLRAHNKFPGYSWSKYKFVTTEGETFYIVTKSAEFSDFTFYEEVELNDVVRYKNDSVLWISESDL